MAFSAYAGAARGFVLLAVLVCVLYPQTSNAKESLEESSETPPPAGQPNSGAVGERVEAELTSTISFCR